MGNFSQKKFKIKNVVTANKNIGSCYRKPRMNFIEFSVEDIITESIWCPDECPPTQTKNDGLKMPFDPENCTQFYTDTIQQ